MYRRNLTVDLSLLFRYTLRHTTLPYLPLCLDHPNVIQFYGIVTEQPRIVVDCIVTGLFKFLTCIVLFVLEFAENGSIYDYH